MHLRNSIVALLLSLSSLAFATDHCGNDPTKPDPVPFKCNGKVDQGTNHEKPPLGFQVIEGDCYSRQWCSEYDFAAQIVESASMHGRHGHGPNAAHTWTAYRQWDVPEGTRKNLTVTVTVSKGLDVIQNGKRLKPNSIGQYSIVFSEGYMVITPSETADGAKVEQPDPTEEQPMKSELRGSGMPEAVCVSPKCSTDAVPYSSEPQGTGRYAPGRKGVEEPSRAQGKVSTDAEGKCYGRKGIEIPCDEPSPDHPE